MIKLDDFRIKSLKKKLRDHFWKQSNEIPNRILTVYIYYVNIVYVPHEDLFKRSI